jgi:hypothetical protein
MNLVIYAVATVTLVITWAISLFFAFVGGFWVKLRKRPSSAAKEPTEDEKKAIRRQQKEQENFMAYDGTPQNAINDYD